MKPKLLIGRRGSGKTQRLLETVMWLKALVICYSNDAAKYLERKYRGQKCFERVSFISANQADRFCRERDFDIVCVDEWRKCYKNSIVTRYIDTALEYSKIQPVFTERLDTEHFDVEIL